MILQKLLALFCFISVGFSAYDTIPFKNLDVKLAEAGVRQELLPMNHHAAAQRVKNARFIFGVGQNLRFYPYPKAVNFDKLLFPQSYVAAFVEMLFPNPHMFAANQSPDAIAKIPFRNLGLLARHLVTAEYVAAIDTFANAINLGTNSSSTPQNFDETALLEFQRISFYQEIRRQAHHNSMTRDEDSFEGVPADKRTAYLVSEEAELKRNAADLLAHGFFDMSPETDVPNIAAVNASFMYMFQRALEENKTGTMPYILVEAINTFAWQKFKKTDDILDYYKGITGSEELGLDFETFSFEHIRTAAKQLEEDKCFDDLPSHFRTAIVKYTLIQAAPPFSGVRYRSATYIDPASKRKTAFGFADCVESQARAIFNGVTHQCTELGITFNPDLLPTDAPVRLFYQDFPLPEHISMQEAHDKFAGLAAKHPGVKYATPKNQPDISKRVAEVWAGKLNLVKVLCHMSGCYSQLEEVIAGPPPQDCLEEGLRLLSTHLFRPGFTLEFECDFDELTYDRTLNDFVGDILGKINGEKTFLLKSSSGHGELKPLVKQKHTWLNDLPTTGPEFHALPDDLKHYVYLGMSSATLSGLDPVLQRAIILNCPLDDIDTQIDRSIHCFSQSNPIVRELALPIANKLLSAYDNTTTKTFLSKLCVLMKNDSSCLTEREFKALCHDNFLDTTSAVEVVAMGERQISHFMTAYGYKKGWLTEASFYKIEHLSFYGWETLHEFFDVTPFSNADYINILRMCKNTEALCNCDLPKDHASASQFVSAITHLPKLTSLNINLSDHTASNPFLARICELPKTLETLNIRGDLFDKSAQSVLIEVAIDCVKYLPALKYLSMNVESEEMLRSVLPILRPEGLPTERIAIDCLYSGDSQIYRTRVSGIYQEVLGHEYPENH